MKTLDRRPARAAHSDSPGRAEATRGEKSGSTHGAHTISLSQNVGGRIENSSKHTRKSIHRNHNTKDNNGHFESKRKHTQNESTPLNMRRNIMRPTIEPKEGSPTIGGAVHPRSESLQRVRRPSYLREGPKTQRNRRRGLRSTQACLWRKERRRNTQANSRR